MDIDYDICKVISVTAKDFEIYLKELSNHKPNESKIVIIDNHIFHSFKDSKVPKKIKLMRITPYTHELNPCGQVWIYIKNRYKKETYESLDKLKYSLNSFVNKMTDKTIKSILSNHHYINAFFTKQFIQKALIFIAKF